MITCFGKIHERDGRMDGQIVTPHDGISCTCTALRGKKPGPAPSCGMNTFCNKELSSHRQVALRSVIAEFCMRMQVCMKKS